MGLDHGPFPTYEAPSPSPPSSIIGPSVGPTPQATISDSAGLSVASVPALEILAAASEAVVRRSQRHSMVPTHLTDYV